jgi:hypothetical protein
MGYNSLSFRLPGISGAPHAVAATAANDQYLLGLNRDLDSFCLAHFVSLCLWPIVAAVARCYTAPSAIHAPFQVHHQRNTVLMSSR